MTDTVLAQLAALKTAPIGVLKQRWRDLFETAPPAYSRKFMQARLGQRIQELAYGGPDPGIVRQLEEWGERLSKVRGRPKHRRDDRRPIAGTRLIREWQGIDHCVTVRDADYEYQGRPFRSLSAIARAITGTRWNGWVFFGLKNQRTAE